MSLFVYMRSFSGTYRLEFSARFTRDLLNLNRCIFYSARVDMDAESGSVGIFIICYSGSIDGDETDKRIVLKLEAVRVTNIANLSAVVALNTRASCWRVSRDAHHALSGRE